MKRGFTDVRYTDRFKNSYRKLTEQQQAAVDQVIRDLHEPTLPKRLRFHPINGYRPKVFKIDVFPDRSYQISLNTEGTTAVLRFVGTHKQLDREP